MRGTLIVIGPGCVVDSFVKIKPVGGSGDVVLGKNCYLNSGVVIYSGNGVTLGDDVLIAANCTLAPVNHEFSDRSRPVRQQGFAASRGGIVVGDDVWIGANTVLLDGTDIGTGCIVGAQSLVRGRLEPHTVYAGSPAVQVGVRS